MAREEEREERGKGKGGRQQGLYLLHNNDYRL
jgi:hypothetical protein